jgi:hypothetical protein
MKKRLPLVAAVIFLTTLQYHATAAHYPTLKDTAMNTLTREEKAQGWQLLFDGKTMQGWRTYQNKPQTSWQVSNGILSCTYDTSHALQHADLITDKQYKNFELALDWKVEPRANSGILYLVNEKYEHAFQSGPEYQLLDDEWYLNNEHIHASQRSGANYDMDAPAADALKPVGEWNHTRIIVNNGQVAHWLNGQKLVEYEIGSPSWKEHRENSKWKDVEGYAANQTGHIDLQDHGGGVSFRNIKIREL